MNDRPHSPSEGAEESTSSRYEPGIDGLRAVAVLSVLLFHAGLGIAVGGYLGVSLFFTLSGFLITKLLFEEVAVSGTIDLGRFLTRRLRRLAPASYVCLLLVAACAPWFAAGGQPLALRGDLLAAAAYVANFRFLLSNQSYADLFVGGPSPVLHFWSLAIEEQFYLVYPMLLALAAWAGRRVRALRRVSVPTWTVVGLTVLSLVAILLNRSGDAAYYATHLRAAELLIGGLAAVLVRRVGMRRFHSRSRRWSLLGTVGAIAFVVLVASLDQTASFLDHGGFALLAILWCLVILGVLVRGPLRMLLSTAPLVHLGRLSFSLYLFHWPVFLLLTPERTDLGRWWLLALRLSVSYVVAALSFRLVEHPIRHRSISLAGLRGALAYGVVVALTVGIAFVQLRPVRADLFDATLSAPDEVVNFAPESAAPPPPLVVVVGSEHEVAALVEERAPDVDVVDLTQSGCSMLDTELACVAPAFRYRQFVAAHGNADAVVLAFGVDDHRAVTRRLSADGVLHGGDFTATHEQMRADLAFVGQLRLAVPSTVPIIMVDGYTGTDDTFTTLSEEVRLAQRSFARVAPADLGPSAFGATAAQRTRVMVIGDSASYGAAMALDRVAGDELDVMWAGRRRCPIAAATETRWFAGAEWTLEDCISLQQQWPSMIAEFHPQILLIVETLPEHSDQRYAGSDEWFHSGDERFATEHAAALERLLTATEPYGTQILITDSQHSDAADPARVDAWNQLLQQWAATYGRVSVVATAAMLDAREQELGRSVRPDGLHLDEETALLVGREVLLPAIQRYVSRG